MKLMVRVEFFCCEVLGQVKQDGYGGGDIEPILLKLHIILGGKTEGICLILHTFTEPQALYKALKYIS